MQPLPMSRALKAGLGVPVECAAMLVPEEPSEDRILFDTVSR